MRYPRGSEIVSSSREYRHDLNARECFTEIIETTLDIDELCALLLASECIDSDIFSLPYEQTYLVH